MTGELAGNSLLTVSVIGGNYLCVAVPGHPYVSIILSIHISHCHVYKQ